MTPRHKIFLASVAAIVLLGMAVAVWMTVAVSADMGTGQAASRRLLEQMDLKCPAGTRADGQEWGKAGWQRFCATDTTRHGPWLAAEAGALAIKGSFSDGHPSGTWQYYDSSGNIEKTVEQNAGASSASTGNTTEEAARTTQ